MAEFQQGGKDIVVITGGSGFLAQFLVREIQLRWADRVSEIRVLDKRPFSKFLDFEERIPIKEFIVDILEEDELFDPLDNATIVFHTAARTMDLEMYTKTKRYMEDNFQGTKQLVFSMMDKGVKWLVYTSDAFAALTSCASIGTSENTSQAPKTENFNFGGYAKSKFFAERWLSCPSARTFSRGKEVKVITIRPSVLYGEGEGWLVPYSLRFCRQYGSLPAINRENGRMTMAYVGNCAYLQLLAADQLRQRPEQLDGEVFNCTDGPEATPVNFFDYIEPFVRNAGYKVHCYNMPFLPVCYLYALVEWFFLLLFYAFGCRYDHLLPNGAALKTANYSILTVTGSKARLVLDYVPIYDPKEAMQRTIQWWKNHWKTAIR